MNVNYNDNIDTWDDKTPTLSSEHDDIVPYDITCIRTTSDFAILLVQVNSMSWRLRREDEGTGVHNETTSIIQQLTGSQPSHIQIIHH